MQFSSAVSDDVDGTHLAQDTDQWSALMKTVINLPVPYKTTRFPIKQAFPYQKDSVFGSETPANVKLINNNH